MSVASTAYAKEILSVTTGAAVGFATSTTGVKRVLVTVDDNDIRFWYDGSTPTAAEGHHLYADSSFVILGADNAGQFLAIGVSGTAQLQCTFEQ